MSRDRHSEYRFYAVGVLQSLTDSATCSASFSLLTAPEGSL